MTRSRDSEVDRQPTRAVSGPGEPVEPECQRLVANPFLGLLLLICAYESFLESISRKNLALFIIGICLSVVAILVVQYHCLDCGKTGWFWRASRHACAAVTARGGIGENVGFAGRASSFSSPVGLSFCLGCSYSAWSYSPPGAED